MSKRVHVTLKTHHGALKMLSKTKGKKFDLVLKNTPSMMKAIRILFQYMLKGRLGLKAHHVKKLKKHGALIRKVADGKAKLSHVQKGGSIISSILSTVLPLLATIL